MIEQRAVIYPNLQAEIARSGETFSMLADLLGLSLSGFSRRINGIVEWSKSEIDTLCEHYNKPYDYLFGE